MQHLWVSLLAHAGCLVQRTSAEGQYQGALVVYVCEWGLLLWEVNTVLDKNKNTRYYVLQHAVGPLRYQYIFIDGPKLWTTARLVPVHPASAHETLPSEGG